MEGVLSLLSVSKGIYILPARFVLQKKKKKQDKNNSLSHWQMSKIETDLGNYWALDWKIILPVLFGYWSRPKAVAPFDVVLRNDEYFNLQKKNKKKSQ